MRAAALAVAVIALACAGGSAYALRVPARAEVHGLSEVNPWNRRVDKLPVARNSAAVIASIGVDTGLHADFGSGLWEGSPIGIPFDVVTRKTPRAKVGFEYADESDRVGYPIPKRVHIEGGSDHHALLLDRDACRLYELGGLEKQGGRWHGVGRRDLEPALEPRPARGLDLGGRGRPADLPRARALGRGEARRDRPRAPLHRPADAPRLPLPRPALRELAHRREPAADGPARAPEGELRHPARTRARRGSC